MPHLVLTGGSGYLGGVILDRFLEEGWRATLLLREPARLHPRHRGHVEVVAGDLRAGPPRLPPAELLIHAAAEMRLHLSLGAMRPGTVLGTRHAMEAALQAGIPRAVHLSSAAVLGFEEDVGGVDEAQPWGPSPWPYTLCKREAEREARLAEGKGLGLCILRPGFVYGPRDRRTMPQVVAMLRARRLRQLIEGGRIDVGACHEETLAEAAWLASTRPEALGKAYHVGDGEPLSLAQMGRDLAKALGVPPPRGRVSRELAMVAARAIAWGWGLAKGGEVEPPFHPFHVAMLTRDAGISVAAIQRELGLSSRRWSEALPACVAAWTQAPTP